jgi:hypothetical protein
MAPASILYPSAIVDEVIEATVISRDVIRPESMSFSSSAAVLPAPEGFVLLAKNNDNIQRSYDVG